jgi:hypothetical protein
MINDKYYNIEYYKNGFDTPILFIIFNRPDTTQQVFDQIKKIKPKKLFITADGPRNDEEKEMCIKTRLITEQIDWNCEVKKNYSDKNLGCKIGVSSGINWFFNQAESGIILEDDCLPNLSFFWFCEQMLRYYENNKKIGMITGDNFQNGKARGDGSYYFSGMANIWGWATWKRAWKYYDIQMNDYPNFKKNNDIKKIWRKKYIQKFWLEKFDLAYNNQIDTWDYQWTYTICKNKLLSITPNKNLVTNIGFGTEATHTKKDKDIANLETITIKTIKHPKKIKQNLRADYYYFKRFNNNITNRIFKKIKNFFNI